MKKTDTIILCEHCTHSIECKKLVPCSDYAPAVSSCLIDIHYQDIFRSGSALN